MVKFPNKHVNNVVISFKGFQFSVDEKSALEQIEGGPCAVIAPLQAFIIKNMLCECEGPEFVNNVRKICISVRNSLNKNDIPGFR